MITRTGIRPTVPSTHFQNAGHARKRETTDTSRTLSDSKEKVEVAESAGGVRATLDPSANLVRTGLQLWPVPELIQKLYASER